MLFRCFSWSFFYCKLKSTIVSFNYHDAFSDGNLILKFIFSKNMDKKWVLTSIEPVQGVGSEGLGNWVRKNKNINIPAQ